MPLWLRLLWWWRGGTFQHGQSSEFRPIILTHRYVVGLFAFLISVDLIEIVGVLCYQLFTSCCFPWHLYPMMLNRAVELLSLLCSHGHIPPVYSVAQVFLTLLSLAVYAKRQPCGKYNCAATLALYSILISYEMFVTVMAVKVSRMPMVDDDGHIISYSALTQISRAFHMIGLLPRAMRSRLIAQVAPVDDEGPSAENIGKAIGSDESEEVIVAVQQPDGRKLSIAIRLCKGLSSCGEGEGPSSISENVDSAKAADGGCVYLQEQSAEGSSRTSTEHVIIACEDNQEEKKSVVDLTVNESSNYAFSSLSS